MTYQDRPLSASAASNKWSATVTAMLGTFATALSATIPIVALPRITDELGVLPGTAQWLVTGFLAAMTTTMLINAWSVERFGVRNTFVGALAVFGLGSVLGAWGGGIEWLIVARVGQGAAAGVIQPLGMVVIFQAFPQSERGRGYGYYGLGTIIAPAIAPLVGGLLVDWISWRSTFLAPLPICGGAMYMAFRYLTDRDEEACPPPVDIVGLVLGACATTALLWGLSQGARSGWGSPTALIGSASGLLGLVGFVFHQWFVPAPLIDLGVFRSRMLVGGVALTVAGSGGFYASAYVVPLYLQDVIGLSPGTAGMVMLPAGLAMAACFPLAGWLADRTPPAVPVSAGAGAFLVSCVALAMPGTLDPVPSVLGLAYLALLIGLGRVGTGLILPAATAGAMTGLGPLEIPRALAALSFGRQMSAALAVGVMSMVLDAASPSRGDALGASHEMAENTGSMRAYASAFLFIAAVMAITPPALWWMRRSR